MSESSFRLFTRQYPQVFFPPQPPERVTADNKPVGNRAVPGRPVSPPAVGISKATHPCTKQLMLVGFRLIGSFGAQSFLTAVCRAG